MRVADLSGPNLPLRLYLYLNLYQKSIGTREKNAARRFFQLPWVAKVKVWVYKHLSETICTKTPPFYRRGENLSGEQTFDGIKTFYGAGELCAESSALNR